MGDCDDFTCEICRRISFVILFFITGEYHFPKNMTRLSSPIQECGNESERTDSFANSKMLSFPAQEYDNG